MQGSWAWASPRWDSPSVDDVRATVTAPGFGRRGVWWAATSGPWTVSRQRRPCPQGTGRAAHPQRLMPFKTASEADVLKHIDQDFKMNLRNILITYIRNLKYDTNELIYEAETDWHDNRLVVAKREGG